MRSWPLEHVLTAGEIQELANRRAMSDALQARMQEALDLAVAIEAGTATAADQRRALVMCLRGIVRLTRLQLALLDEAD
jgi:hypothetical protein